MAQGRDDLHVLRDAYCDDDPDELEDQDHTVPPSLDHKPIATSTPTLMASSVNSGSLTVSPVLDISELVKRSASSEQLGSAIVH